MMMESAYNDPEDKGFPLTFQEVGNIRNWGPTTESQLVVNILKKWNLKGIGVILWFVENMDKHYSEWKRHQHIYFLPEDGDTLIQDLAKLSLGNTIIYIDDADYVLNVYVGASEDGRTNIDADVLEEFTNAFKREWRNDA
jgi:hypothetical protein